MSIQRLKTHTKDFAILYKQVINDRNLSYKAVGIWTYLMGLPDDWKINCADLANRHTDGYKSTLSGLNELVANGYAYKRNNQTLNKLEDGKFQGGSWVVFEEKTDLKEFEKGLKKSLPYGPFGDTEKGDTHKGELLSIDKLSTKNTKREREPAPSSSGKRERAKNVSTSDKDHQKLIDAHGEDLTQTLYKMLSDWKDITPKNKWKLGDYKSILRWVFDKHLEIAGKNKTGSNHKKPVTATDINRNNNNAYQAREIIKNEGKFVREEDGIREIATDLLIRFDNPDYYNIKEELGIY